VPVAVGKTPGCTGGGGLRGGLGVVRLLGYGSSGVLSDVR